MDKLKNCF